MANKYVQRCATSLIIREIQIKTTVRYHLTPLKMAIIQKITDDTCWPWQRCEEKGTIVRFLWECRSVQPLWKTVWRFLKKLKLELPNDPAIPLLGIYLKEMKSVPQRDICAPKFIAALFTLITIINVAAHPFRSQIP